MPNLPRIQQFLRKRSSLIKNALIFVLVFFGVSTFQARNMLSSSGTPAPALSGTLLYGGTYDLAAAGNRPVLVYFFAPWCAFCAASSDNLTRLRRMRAEESLQILAVALDWQDINEVQEYVDRHGLDLPVLLGDSRVARAWRVHAFPTYYALDSEHRIQRRDLGYSTQLGLLWRTWLLD